MANIRSAGLTLCALLSMLASGCESASDIPGGRYNRSFVFDNDETVSAESVTPTSGARTIRINGVFEAPGGCHNLVSQIDDDNRELEVTITAQAGSGTCNETNNFFRYTMITGFFFPGSYHLRIVHTDPAKGTRTMYDASIAVQF